MIKKICRWSAKCPDYLDSAQTILNYQKGCAQMIRKGSGWYEKCFDDLRQSKKYPYDLQSVWMICKVSGWSRKCLDDLENVHLICKTCFTFANLTILRFAGWNFFGGCRVFDEFHFWIIRIITKKTRGQYHSSKTYIPH